LRNKIFMGIPINKRLLNARVRMKIKVVETFLFHSKLFEKLLNFEDGRTE